MTDYPKFPDYWALANEIAMYAQLKHELGAKNIDLVLSEAHESLRTSLLKIKSLEIDSELAKKEPSKLEDIHRLRPAGPRRLWDRFEEDAYVQRLEGGMLGRFAGCTLGAPVEFWNVERMKSLAEENGDDFPPTQYWRYVPEPKRLRYNISRVEGYTRGGMDGVPVDDDIMYTILGLLIVEESGIDFSTEDVAQAWMKYLPWTWDNYVWANLKATVPATEAAEKDNPKVQLINASIRADAWGYLVPGNPELAAALAWKDGILSHRRNGLYAEMFFAAAISAAFALEEPIKALEIALTEIPEECTFSQNIRWALKYASSVHDYKDARAAIDQRFGCGNENFMFEGMHPVHSINNACCTVFGLVIGNRNFTKVIGETVAMGMDNDCTAATAGSIVGASIGKKGIPEHWYKSYNDIVHSYLIGHSRFSITDLIQRFTKQAQNMWNQHSGKPAR